MLKVKQLTARQIKEGGKEFYSYPSCETLYHCANLNWHVVNWSVEYGSQFYAFKKLEDARKFIKKRFGKTLVATRFYLPTIKEERENLRKSCPQWYKEHEDLNVGCYTIPYD